jgi:subtilase family serine protease
MRRAGRVVGLGLSGLFVVAGGLSSALGLPAGSHRDVAAHLQPTVQGTHGSTVDTHAPTTKLLDEAQCVATPGIRIPCYDPAQIQAAYDEQPLFDAGITGVGETIVIVDSFGSPTLRSDLATFDRRFRLPAPPTLQVIQPAGPVPRYDAADTTMVGWAGETTLDVEWAHAIAPGASIVVVETPVSETEGTAGFPQIVAAENYVIDHRLGQVISQSFGATEQTFPSVQALLNLRSAFVNAARQGVTVLAASGDTGATDLATATATTYSTQPAITWPASDPLVTAVGGTELQLGAHGQRTAPDRVWNDTYDPVVNDYLYGTTNPHPDATGGGLSSVFPRPAYQDGVASVVGARRGIPDVSMSAACSGLVDTYQSFPGQAAGWYYVCGTSEATPMFAGIVALADQYAHRSLGFINLALYSLARGHAPGIVQVPQGDNTVSFTQTGTERTVVGYGATAGYSLAAGVGTIDAAQFVPELAQAVATVGDTPTAAALAGPSG